MKYKKANERLRVALFANKFNVNTWSETLSEDDLMMITTYSFDLINDIGNYSLPVMTKAVSLDPWSIKYFNEQPEHLQIKAVQCDGGILSVIRNPSYSVQVEALKRSPSAIRYIDKPDNHLISIAHQTTETKLINEILRDKIDG